MLSLSPPSTAYILDKFARRLKIKMERVDIAHRYVRGFVVVNRGPFGWAKGYVSM